MYPQYVLTGFKTAFFHRGKNNKLENKNQDYPLGT